MLVLLWYWFDDHNQHADQLKLPEIIKYEKEMVLLTFISSNQITNEVKIILFFTAICHKTFESFSLCLVTRII